MADDCDAAEGLPGEETCNGLCRPELSLYEGRCPAHGFRFLITALGWGEPKEDERA